MLTKAVAHPRNPISSLVDGREEVSLYPMVAVHPYEASGTAMALRAHCLIVPMEIIASLLRFAGSVRCVDRSGFHRHRAAAHAALLHETTYL